MNHEIVPCPYCGAEQEISVMLPANIGVSQGSSFICFGCKGTVAYQYKFQFQLRVFKCDEAKFHVEHKED